MITIQNYVKAKSLEEAYELNQKRNNRILGGMLWVKMTTANVNTVIDLSELGLDTIEETDEEFILGAMVTLRELENHEGLNAYTDNAVKDALKDIVGVQFRNLATIGGSIWGRFGFSDVLTVFLSMDTYVELYKAGTIPLSEFVKMKYDRDLLIRIRVKKTPGKYTYDAVRIQRTDFPVITCAISKVAGEYRLVVGARPGKARLLLDENNLLAEGITQESITAFAKWASGKLPTGTNNRGSAAYRSRLIRTLIGRQLTKFAEEQ